VFTLSRRVVLYSLLWIFVIPLSLVVTRLSEARSAEQAQQQPSCPGGPLENFVTGTGEGGVLSPEAVANGAPMSGRSWDPGSRSYWHCHGGGQFVIVMEGIGRAQKRGERMRDLKVGDIEFALPGVEHWHGASSTTAARHLNQTLSYGGGTGTYWMEEVSDADYLGNDIGIASRNRYLETGVR
jgi:quercetin dioxygenase-like cupin family protein